jgi:23S rRNA pseudouridine2457 synthase
MLIAFHKPYGVLSQFSRENTEWRTLKEFGFPRGAYPIGRLDAQSEGLILLSDEGELVDILLHPRHGHRRQYWAQVENIPTAEALATLEQGGIPLGEHKTLPCRAWVLDPQPEVPPRDPPIRLRKAIPDCWMALELTEGKNHQVRRMTAAVGHPTLRLLRVKIGDFELGTLPAGEWRELGIEDRKLVLAGTERPKARVAPKPGRSQNRRR